MRTMLLSLLFLLSLEAAVSAQVREKAVPPQTIPQAGETWIHGGAFDINFRDEAPNGGLLIGFEAGYGKFVGHTIITAIEPIYRTPTGEVSGERQSIGRLAEWIDTPLSTAVRWIDYLEKKQLVEREPHRTDKRITFINLSSGHTYKFGKVDHKVLASSFFGK